MSSASIRPVDGSQYYQNPHTSNVRINKRKSSDKPSQPITLSQKGKEYVLAIYLRFSELPRMFCQCKNSHYLERTYIFRRIKDDKLKIFGTSCLKEKFKIDMRTSRLKNVFINKSYSCIASTIGGAFEDKALIEIKANLLCNEFSGNIWINGVPIPSPFLVIRWYKAEKITSKDTLFLLKCFLKERLSDEEIASLNGIVLPATPDLDPINLEDLKNNITKNDIHGAYTPERKRFKLEDVALPMQTRVIKSENRSFPAEGLGLHIKTEMYTEITELCSTPEYVNDENSELATSSPASIRLKIQKELDVQPSMVFTSQKGNKYYFAVYLQYAPNRIQCQCKIRRPHKPKMVYVLYRGKDEKIKIVGNTCIRNKFNEELDSDNSKINFLKNALTNRRYSTFTSFVGESINDVDLIRLKADLLCIEYYGYILINGVLIPSPKLIIEQLINKNINSQEAVKALKYFLKETNFSEEEICFLKQLNLPNRQVISLESLKDLLIKKNLYACSMINNIPLETQETLVSNAVIEEYKSPETYFEVQENFLDDSCLENKEPSEILLEDPDQLETFFEPHEWQVDGLLD